MGPTYMQESLTKQQAQQEAGLRDVQGLVGAALAVPREVVQPAFAALGKRHLSILKQHAALQHQPALVAAVMGCIGEATTWMLHYQQHAMELQSSQNSMPCCSSSQQ